MGMGQIVDYSQFILQLEKAIANGVATLDSNAKVPKNQIDLDATDVGAITDDGDAVLSSLNTATGTISSSILPSYVDDVLNFANLAAFPVTGETGKIYVTENDNKTYRWTGSVYVEISSSSIPSWSDITGKPSPIEYLSSNPNPPNYNYWLFGNFYGQYWELIPVSQNPGNNTVALRTSTGGIVGTTLSATVTTPSTSPTTGASVVAGGQGVGGNQHVGGFTSLGGVASGHPAIKIKIIEGTMPSTEGGTTFLAHGLNILKIQSVDILANFNNTFLIPVKHVLSLGFGFNFNIDTTNINIKMEDGNSANLISAPFCVTIIYKE